MLMYFEVNQNKAKKQIIGLSTYTCCFFYFSVLSFSVWADNILVHIFPGQDNTILSENRLNENKQYDIIRYFEIAQPLISLT